MKWIRYSLAASSLALGASCGSEVAREAQRADDDGEVISNTAMSAMYPNTFEPGDPAYLERDFEAGAEFICDEVERVRGTDVCADSDIGWRD